MHLMRFFRFTYNAGKGRRFMWQWRDEKLNLLILIQWFFVWGGFQFCASEEDLLARIMEVRINRREKRTYKVTARSMRKRASLIEGERDPFLTKLDLMSYVSVSELVIIFTSKNSIGLNIIICCAWLAFISVLFSGSFCFNATCRSVVCAFAL